MNPYRAKAATARTAARTLPACVKLLAALLGLVVMAEVVLDPEEPDPAPEPEPEPESDPELEPEPEPEPVLDELEEPEEPDELDPDEDPVWEGEDEPEPVGVAVAVEPEPAAEVVWLEAAVVTVCKLSRLLATVTGT